MERKRHVPVVPRVRNQPPDTYTAKEVCKLAGVTYNQFVTRTTRGGLSPCATNPRNNNESYWSEETIAFVAYPPPSAGRDEKLGSRRPLVHAIDEAMREKRRLERELADVDQWLRNLIDQHYDVLTNGGRKVPRPAARRRVIAKRVRAGVAPALANGRQPTT